MMDENSLEEKCLKLIDDTASDALKSEAFTLINISTIERILKRDTLNIEEIDVYKGCICWAQAECNRQHIEVEDSSISPEYVNRYCRNECLCPCKAACCIKQKQNDSAKRTRRVGHPY